MKFKYIFRYFKKGLTFSVIYYFVGLGITKLYELIFKLQFGDIGSIKNLPMPSAIGMIVTVILVYTIGGFVIEFVEHGKNKFIRWVNK